MRTRTAASLVVLVALACAPAAVAQLQPPLPSPNATVAQTIGMTKVEVVYSRPHVKGPTRKEERVIWGALVPYGEVWRAGANEATTFVTTADLMVGGHHVPAGNYTLFTIPNQDKWTLIISKKTGEWGVPYPGADSDLARLDMKVSPTSSAVENFAIAFDKGAKGCTLRMEWENTRASIDLSAM